MSEPSLAIRKFSDLANPTRFLALVATIWPWLAGLTLCLFAAGLYLSFTTTGDYQQGETVRIMYVHVPAAWLSMMCYSVMALSALGTLVWRHPLADVSAKAAAPIGACFTLVALITGSLWGKPMWGTWWVWDARLTSVLVLFFLWLGHAALVRAFDDPERGARAGAILALVGIVNVPIVKFSVDWWNTLHQPASVTRLNAPGMHVDILYPLLVCALGFSLLFGAVVLARTRAAVMERRVRALQLARARREDAVPA